MQLSSLSPERSSGPTMPVIAATSLATAVLVWMLYRSSSSFRPAPSLKADKDQSIRHGLIAGLASSIAETPARAIGILNSTGRRLFRTWAEPRSNTDTGPPGLNNPNYACFENSVIQGFAGLDSLRQFLHRVTIAYPNLPDESTTRTLSNFLDRLTDERNNGLRFWLPSPLKSMDSWQQQDAQEYFSKLLDLLDQDLKTALKKTAEQNKLDKKAGSSSKKAAQTKWVRNPLEGLTGQYVQCTRCGFSDGLTLSPFTCFTLSLNSDQVHDVRSCLDRATVPEQIENVSCAKCTVVATLNRVRQERNKLAESVDSGRAVAAFNDRIRALERAITKNDFSDSIMADSCRISPSSWVTTTKSRQAVIASPPQALALHVNRSVFDERTFAMRKNSSPVRFPIEFDISAWCIGQKAAQLPVMTDARQAMYTAEFAAETAHLAEKPTDKPVRSRSKHSVDVGLTSSLVSILPQSGQDCQSFDWRYRLRAVIVHHGTHENGHYICFRYKPENPLSARQLSPILQSSLGSTSSSPTTTTAAAAAAVPDQETESIEEPVVSPDKTGSNCSSGTTASGTTATKAKDGTWWYMSDEDVVRTSEQSVLEQGDAFMLFYDRVPVHDPDSRAWTAEKDEKGGDGGIGAESVLSGMPSSGKSDEPGKTLFSSTSSLTSTTSTLTEPLSESDSNVRRRKRTTHSNRRGRTLDEDDETDGEN